MNSDEIHSISIPMGALTFTWRVGQEVKLDGTPGVMVSKIIRDENNFFQFGVIRYIVCVRKPGSEDDIVWKTYEGPIPVTATYKI